MKRMLWALFAFAMIFAFAVPVLAAVRNPKIHTYNTYHRVQAPAVNVSGAIYLEKQTFAGEKYNIRLSNFRGFSFRSNRVGWGDNSMARSVGWKTVRNRLGLWVVYIVPRTFDSDQGNWLGDKRSGTDRWLNVPRIEMSGLPWIKVHLPEGDQVRYGNYQEPTISFVAPGTAVIEWNANGLFGFINPISDPSKVAFVRWNGNDGWFASSTKTCVPEVVTLNHYQCVIAGMLNSDIGAFHAVMTDVSLNWLDNSKWRFSPNVQLHTDGKISYILP